MPYIPATSAQRDDMLHSLGLRSMEELFCEIPEAFRFPPLNLEEGLSEGEVLRECAAFSEGNVHAETHRWFLGAGCYHHFIPSAVGALAGRGEFLTAYTPYQPEVSQGTLQAIFEYQSMIAALFGMEVVNAGHYDGAAALAEAVIIALKEKGGGKGQRVLVPAGLHPEYREVLSLYLSSYEPLIESYSGNPAAVFSGAALSGGGENAVGAVPGGPDLACLVSSYPDFFGSIPNLAGAAEAVHHAGGLFIVQADPVMAGLFKSPGEYGADIVTAEGQCLGNDMNYGGPLLGIMAVTKSLMRKIPGRIVGEARDKAGRRGYALTLSAREQHIRRERAVSNICSNQGLSMLRSCIYLALMGKEGLRETAELCWHRSHHAAARIAALPGFSAASESGGPGGTFFREFTVQLPSRAPRIAPATATAATPAGDVAAAGDTDHAEAVYRALLAQGIVPGLPLSRYFPERTNELLVCVTENNSAADIDSLVRALGELYP